MNDLSILQGLGAVDPAGLNGPDPFAEPSVQLMQPFEEMPGTAGRLRSLLDMIRDKQAENRQAASGAGDQKFLQPGM
jgi:hypothetical protein